MLTRAERLAAKRSLTELLDDSQMRAVVASVTRGSGANRRRRSEKPRAVLWRTDRGARPVALANCLIVQFSSDGEGAVWERGMGIISSMKLPMFLESSIYVNKKRFPSLEARHHVSRKDPLSLEADHRD